MDVFTENSLHHNFAQACLASYRIGKNMQHATALTSKKKTILHFFPRYIFSFQCFFLPTTIITLLLVAVWKRGASPETSHLIQSNYHDDFDDCDFQSESAFAFGGSPPVGEQSSKWSG